MSTWVVYIMECRNRSFYTGITTDVFRRMRQHRQGKGSRYARSFGVRSVVYTEACRSRGQALRREAAIKRLSRPQKNALVAAFQVK